MLAAIFIILGFFAQMSLAEEPTFPEFECLFIKIENPIRVKEIFGNAKIPSIALRRKTSGDWTFRVQDKQFDLGKSAATKNESSLSLEYQYSIQHVQRNLKIELKGKPPSRQGKIWIEDQAPARSTFLGELTCH